MKHLKTYETLNSNIDNLNKIKSWMNKHKLEKVDLNLQLHDNNITIIDMLLKDSNDFYVIYHWNYYLEKTPFKNWVGIGTDDVLYILENMTPEEIEEQRIRNESEKFNL